MEFGAHGTLGQCGHLVTRPVETDGKSDREHVYVIIPRRNMAACHAPDLISIENPELVYKNIVQMRTVVYSQELNEYLSVQPPIRLFIRSVLSQSVSLLLFNKSVQAVVIFQYNAKFPTFKKILCVSYLQG